MELKNNTILITGGASGIGFALAKQLSERGNQVIICGRRENALAKAKSVVPALVTRVCDITEAGSRRALIDWLNANYPGLNVLLNNAGAQRNRILRGSGAFDSLDQEVAVNFTAHVHMIGELLPSLHQQSGATIINVSSGLAFTPRADSPVYCATKAALHSFTLSLRYQLKATGIKVVEIIPPRVNTELFGDNITDAARHSMMPPDVFATDVLNQLAEDKDEVIVGMAVELRKHGEAMFERLNSY